MTYLPNRRLLALSFWFLVPQLAWSQPTFEIVVMTDEAYPAEMYFNTVGPPYKPVNILSAEGEMLFSDVWGPLKAGTLRSTATICPPITTAVMELGLYETACSMNRVPLLR